MSRLWRRTSSLLVNSVSAISRPGSSRQGSLCSLDAAGFPHIRDLILDHVCAAHSVRTLYALRLVSSGVRDAVDARLARHVVVRRDGVRTYVGGLGACARARPRVVDLHHPLADLADGHAVRGLLEPPAAVRYVRIFHRHLAADQPRVPASCTVIQFRHASHARPADHERSVVFGLQPRARRNVLRLGYSAAHGLQFGVYYDHAPAFDAAHDLEVVLLLLARPPRHALRAAASRWASLARLVQRPRPNSALNILIRETLGLLHRHARIRVRVVGAETWDERWFSHEKWPSGAEPPDFDRMPPVHRLWECGLRWYDKTDELRDRLAFVSLPEFRAEEPELYDLCADE